MLCARTMSAPVTLSIVQINLDCELWERHKFLLHTIQSKFNTPLYMVTLNFSTEEIIGSELKL
jgi:hypothetical protein